MYAQEIKALSRLKYIMLSKLPIILSSNSFYFNQLAIPKIILSIKHPTISLIYIAMVKIQYRYILLLHEIQKRFVVLSISKGYFQ